MVCLLTDAKAAFDHFLIGVLVFLAIMIVLTFIRVLKGPRVADRVVGVNCIGTLTIMCICVLSVLMREDYLTDVALIYAMISFLAVVVLTKIFMGAYLEKMDKKKQKDELENGESANQKEG